MLKTFLVHSAAACAQWHVRTLEWLRSVPVTFTDSMEITGKGVPRPGEPSNPRNSRALAQQGDDVIDDRQPCLRAAPSVHEGLALDLVRFLIALLGS